MKCQISFIVFCVLSWAKGAPSRGGFKTFDDNDRVSSLIIDPNSNDTDFEAAFSRNDKVISTYLDLNAANTSALLSNFNITKDFLLRKIAAASTVQPGYHQNNDDNGGGTGGVSDDAEHADEKG